MSNKITRESMDLIIEKLLDIAASNCREKVKAAQFEKVLINQGLVEIIEESKTDQENFETEFCEEDYRIVEKYVQIYSLDEATDEETVCAFYPRATKNVSGKKNDPQILEAEKDALGGACKLLVWRTVKISE